MCAEGAIDEAAQARLIAATRGIEKLDRATEIADLMIFEAAPRQVRAAE